MWDITDNLARPVAMSTSLISTATFLQDRACAALPWFSFRRGLAAKNIYCLLLPKNETTYRINDTTSKTPPIFTPSKEHSVRDELFTLSNWIIQGE